ncbi:TonB-dependent receptor [Acidipila rosea]|uniref:TonB-dependent receptor-like protein n=1 Tax=Acidipila rosea TaxID=768535 RepID=A0A4R1L0U9_9BACT|nr:TonB-dependent receptor [Acidipila rosea]MBW4027634.1 TonB-dependent receptor [Acidobacteriota bacterium]MBW4045393.1 TonB-dependent receptor [Acidobacteriota bacterium]TCK71535.1 TonB-dependent receptor-like protein [Acidipila rosea]
MKMKLQAGTLFLSTVIALGGVVTMTPQTALAQAEAGTVSGTVLDQSGAAVPGANITLTKTDTGLVRQSVSSGSGAFQFPSLVPGPYELKVTSTGFNTYDQKLVVTVGAHVNVETKLSVSNQQTTVQVSELDTASGVNTTDQQISETITPREMQSLPSLTRNPYDFVTLSGNISADPNGSTGPNGVGVAIDGMRSASTGILLDGVENVDTFGASVGQNIPLDSVQEFSIVTNGFMAEYGRASGGIVNVVTKSGTNDFHGSLYEYNRISALAANTYNESATNVYNLANGLPRLPHDRFTRNQFGYSVGGPIKHDKLFFFSNTEWTRIASAGLQQAVVPTAAFIASSAPATQSFFNQYGKLAPNAVVGQPVNVKGFDGPTPLQEVNFSVPSNAGAGDPQGTYSILNRIDYNISDRTLLYGRYGLFNQDAPAGTNAFSPYAGYNTGYNNYDQNLLISLTHTFGPSLVSESRLAYNRLNNSQPLGTAPVGPTLYLNQANTASVDGGTGRNIAMPGYLPYSPGNALPFGGPQNVYQFSQDLSWTVKQHSFRFGGEFIQIRDNRVFGAYENSVEQVAKSGTAEGTSLAALQAGMIYSFSGAINPQGKFPCPTNEQGVTQVSPGCSVTLPVSAPSFTRENTFNDGAAYAQDSWKATPTLTINLGLRWEYYGVQHNSNPNIESNFFLGTGSNLFDQIRNGQVLLTPQSPTHGLYAQQFHNFGPRLGFAWDVKGDGKWSVRGGYGIAYERDFGNVTYNVIQNPPDYAVISLVAGVDVPTLPVYSDNAGPLAGSGTKALPKVSLRAPQQNIPTAYAHMYNLSVEHEVAQSTTVGIEYTGSRGIHQYSIANYNILGGGNVYEHDTNPYNRLNYQYSGINVREANGDSYYNALNIRLNSTRFASEGIQAIANYTLAHSMDNLSSTFSQSGNNFNLGYLNPFNPGLDHGNSDFDIRHRITIGGTWEPKWLNFHGRSEVLQSLAGGWQFAPIFHAQTGTPFTIYDCTNGLNACPRIVDAPGLKFHGTAVHQGGINQFTYINIPQASANPYVDPILGASDLADCTGGGCVQNPGLGRNSWWSPANYNLDLGLYKNFKIHERYTAQFRGEFYNALNHHNLYIVPGNADYAEVSAIQAVKGAPGGSPGPSDERRQVQLALRLEF